MLRTRLRFPRPIGILASTALVVGLAVTGTTSADASPDASVAAAEEQIRLPIENRPFPWMAAHRGQWRKAPENSLPGIQYAIDDGAEVIEIDIQPTADDELVLMHDTSVERTTNGMGNVADQTLAQLKQLRLLEKLGAKEAPVTEYQIPTFDEVLDLVAGQNVLLNLDKAWPVREQVYQKLVEHDMVEYGLFKSSNLAEAKAFMADHPDARYIHYVGGNYADFYAFDRQPVAYEVGFGSVNDPQVDPAYLKQIQEVSAVWFNAMWNSLAGGYTDEATLRDPDLGWEFLVERGGDIIQTDNIENFDYWRNGGDVFQLYRDADSIRVQAEDFIDDPDFYGDDAVNSCGARAIRNPESPVDACEMDGAHAVQYINTGDWFTLPVEAAEAGRYELRLRYSADVAPGGTVTVNTGRGKPQTVALPMTTQNRNFEVRSVGSYQLKAGLNQVRLDFTHYDYMSLDWVQFD